MVKIEFPSEKIDKQVAMAAFTLNLMQYGKSAFSIKEGMSMMDESWRCERMPKNDIFSNHDRSEVTFKAKNKVDQTVTNDRPTSAVSQGDDIVFSLYDKADDEKFNAVHQLFRRDVLEGFVAKDEPITNDSYPQCLEENRRARARSSRYVGRVGFRCRFCKHRSDRANMAAVYPQSIKNIYRAVIRFQRTHFRDCTFIPDPLKKKYKYLKNGNELSRGRKSDWVRSALRKGLADTQNNEGIMLCPKENSR